MELLFDELDYDRLEVDSTFTFGLSASVVALYRSRLQLLRAARDNRDLQAIRCLRLQRLEISSKFRNSIHLDEQNCLVVELRPHSTVLRIVEVRTVQK
jgi:plasmid maintenance system killer protein